MSNSGHQSRNISSFLDHHLHSLAQAVKSYIRDTNNFLKKLCSPPKFPDVIILCSMDVAGLYPRLAKGLPTLRLWLESKKKKDISTDTSIKR